MGGVYIIHILQSVAQNETARKAQYRTAMEKLHCVALQLQFIADQCASIVVGLEKAVRPGAPGAQAVWQCGRSSSVALMWET